MKFVNTSQPQRSGTRLGCHWDTGYLDITRMAAEGIVTLPTIPSTIEDVLLIDNGLERLESQLQKLQSSGRSLSSYVDSPTVVTLKAPILHPQKLIGIGLNYRDHAEESKVPIPTSPLLFGMYANAIVGPEVSIVIPPATTQVDYEAELAIVIGARALRVSLEDALNYVAGYTIVNDVSARDLQFGEKQWTRGKSIDTFAPMGPCLTTRSELGSADGLSIQCRVNGQTMQNSNTRNLIFNVPALVSHISQTMTLEPGDVISTGTPSGVGYVRKPPVFLKQGDVVEIEVEGIGVLRNPVVHLD